MSGVAGSLLAGVALFGAGVALCVVLMSVAWAVSRVRRRRRVAARVAVVLVPRRPRGGVPGPGGAPGGRR